MTRRILRPVSALARLRRAAGRRAAVGMYFGECYEDEGGSGNNILQETHECHLYSSHTCIARQARSCGRTTRDTVQPPTSVPRRLRTEERCTCSGVRQ